MNVGFATGEAVKILRCPDGFEALLAALERTDGPMRDRLDEALKIVARLAALTELARLGQEADAMEAAE